MNNNLSINYGQNTKLGPNIAVFSRPTGMTCSNNCVHLDNNCYAERIEYRFPNAKRAYLKNLEIADWQKLRAFLLNAKRLENVVRWHQNGDLMKEDSLGRKILDIKYIKAIEKANESIIDDGIVPPVQFMYTHCLYSRVADLSKYMKIFASIDSTLAYRKAKAAGFKLFAWNLPYRKGVDNKRIWENELGKKIIVCWEMLGTKKNCSECKFCFEPHIQQDIGFMQH